MSIIGQSEGFLGRLLGPLLKIGLPSRKNALKPLAKSVLILLGLRESTTNAAIQKKIFRSRMTTLIIPNEEMNDITKIIKSLEDAGLLIKVLDKQLKMKQKNKKVFSACY